MKKFINKMTTVIAVLSIPCISIAQVSAIDYGPCVALAAVNPLAAAAVIQGTPKPFVMAYPL